MGFGTVQHFLISLTYTGKARVPGFNCQDCDSSSRVLAAYRTLWMSCHSPLGASSFPYIFRSGICIAYPDVELGSGIHIGRRDHLKPYAAFRKLHTDTPGLKL